MKIQETPDYLIFADESKTGELLNFPNVLRGWGITIDQTQSKPPMEWMNGAFNRVDKNTLYLLQQGVPEWNASVLYPVNAIIKYKGVLYTAIIQNENALPSTSTTKWSTIIDGKYLPATKNGDSYDVSSQVEFKKTPTVNGVDVLTEETSMGRLINVVKFETSGTYIASTGTKFIIVELKGAGGGSTGVGSSSSNQTGLTAAGCHGSYVKVLLTTNFNNQEIIIGAGGSAGTPSSYGGAGGSSSFGDIIYATGGPGSLAAGLNSSFTAGRPNVGSGTPTINSGKLISCIYGEQQLVALQVTGGFATGYTGSQTQSPYEYGRGGSGIYQPQSSPARNGNPGENGVCIIWEYA